MKTDDQVWGSDLTLPARNVLSEKKFQKVGDGGVLGDPHTTKNAQNNYLGKVKKFQNNRLSHFLMVEVQNSWWSDVTPPRAVKG